ncbi:hypothetical protein C9374_009688 [Naegleria lovaniensis]|uniref:Uncharacterized protein n=1 Tax=Naegleria lovaniensis TaxID=51637 RepID=A0AA88KR92_NAELO|nr:uncharacterized protein C9374_009688 [Naegleria lovaniensis]KAG2393111.1 hypothetical protein C9374_009688 [Naegleria lovaniensis]
MLAPNTPNQPPSSPTQFARRSPVVFRHATLAPSSGTFAGFNSSSKRLACPCLNLQINVLPTTTIAFNEWSKGTNDDDETSSNNNGLNSTDNNSTSRLFSKSIIHEICTRFPSVESRKVQFLKGSSIAGVQSSLDVFMETHFVGAEDGDVNIKVYRCLNCETFFGIYMMKEQTFLLNSTELIDESLQDNIKQQEEYSKIFHLVPKSSSTTNSHPHQEIENELQKHQILVQYQKDMQKKLNDEKLNMEQRIKDFMKNEKLQYQKLLLKTQAEKDIIFRKAKGILSQQQQQSQQSVPTLILENGIDRSEPISESNMTQHKSSTISQDESALSDTSFEASPNTTSFTLDEKIKQAMSTPSFQSTRESKITLSKQTFEQPKLSFNKSVVTPTTEDSDDLTQKSFHYRKMASKNLSRTYTPGAFFNFDEDETETIENDGTQNEEEEEELDSTTESEEMLPNNHIASMDQQQVPSTATQQPRARRRLEFRQPSQLPKPQVNLYGSSVPISIPMRPMKLENAGGTEKLPLYYEATDKQVTPEQRKERTKSFKTKPRLDDDPFTEVPQSYIERYMTFRDEYIKKIEDVPSVQDEHDENNINDLQDTTTTEPKALTEPHNNEDDFSLENDDLEL